MHSNPTYVILISAFLGAGCNNNRDASAGPASSSGPSVLTSAAAVPGEPSAAAATPSAAPAEPESRFKLAEPPGPPRKYRPLRADGQAFKPLKTTCKTPYVKLAEAPNTEWNWIRQAMIANPEFVETAAPSKPMEVAFHEIKGFDTSTLYATCGDAETCNQLAGMLLQVVWASYPKTFCRELPEAAVPVVLTGSDGFSASRHPHLPLCARLNACATRLDPANTRVGPACQKAWTTFPLECARSATCEEVVACMKPGSK